MKSGTVRIGNTTIILPGELEEKVETNTRVIVRFDFSGQPPEHYCHNIWGFNKDGERVWVIGKNELWSPSDQHSCYTGLRMEPNGEIRIWCGNGYMYTLDPENGKWSNPVWVK
jgi:hypothetical protein